MFASSFWCLVAAVVVVDDDDDLIIVIIAIIIALVVVIIIIIIITQVVVMRRKRKRNFERVLANVFFLFYDFDDYLFDWLIDRQTDDEEEEEQQNYGGSGVDEYVIRFFIFSPSLFVFLQWNPCSRLASFLLPRYFLLLVLVARKGSQITAADALNGSMLNDRALFAWCKKMIRVVVVVTMQYDERWFDGRSILVIVLVVEDVDADVDVYVDAVEIVVIRDVVVVVVIEVVVVVVLMISLGLLLGQTPHMWDESEYDNWLLLSFLLLLWWNLVELRDLWNLLLPSKAIYDNNTQWDAIGLYIYIYTLFYLSLSLSLFFSLIQYIFIYIHIYIDS